MSRQKTAQTKAPPHDGSQYVGETVYWRMIPRTPCTLPWQRSYVSDSPAPGLITLNTQPAQSHAYAGLQVQAAFSNIQQTTYSLDEIEIRLPR
jgi:hypothetical protein